MSWFDDAHRKLPSSKDMEFAIGYLLGMKMVHDRAEQDRDIDLRGGHGTASVKYQARAAQTGNLSFESHLINSRDGERVAGNFLKSKAELMVIVVPVPESVGTWTYIVFDTKRLHAEVPRLAHDVKTLTPERRRANAGRQYDDAESWLVRIAALKALALHRDFFRYEELAATPAFLQYRIDNRG